MAPVLMSCDCVAPVSATAQLVVTTMPLLRIPTLSKAAENFERWMIMYMGALLDDVEIPRAGGLRAMLWTARSGRGLTNPPAHAAGFAIYAARRCRQSK